MNGAAPFDRHHARLECSASCGPQHDRQQAVLQAVLAVDVGKAARHDERILLASIPHTAASRDEPAPKFWPVTRMPGLRNCGLLSTKSGSSLPSARWRARMNRSAL